jgi:enoyl-CoA hydratase/carnithine racemase
VRHRGLEQQQGHFDYPRIAPGLNQLTCGSYPQRENTLLGQPEVGVGVHPGGGGTERLPHLVGRGRALEIVLGANDFDGDTAARYGYVNRALPDAELDGFADVLARRIASFDRRLVAIRRPAPRRPQLLSDRPDME